MLGGRNIIRSQFGALIVHLDMSSFLALVCSGNYH